MKFLLYSLCLIFLFSFGHRSFPIMKQKQIVSQFKAEVYYSAGNYYVYYECKSCMTNRYKNGSNDFMGCYLTNPTITYYCKSSLNNFSDVIVLGTYYPTTDCSGSPINISISMTNNITDFNNSCRTTTW